MTHMAAQVQMGQSGGTAHLDACCVVHWVHSILQVLGNRSVPCPTLDVSGGFRAYFDAATGIKSTPYYDPFKNDVNFLLATFSLEEIGATGNQVDHRGVMVVVWVWGL
jgi:hypothetical protein